MTSDEPAAEEFRYSRCAACGGYQLIDVPEQLSAYYRRAYYAEDAPRSDREKAIDRTSVAGQLALIAPIVPGGRLIDVGAHRGNLLDEASRFGFTSRAAVERDPGCCASMRERGIEAVETDDPIGGLRALEPADAITICHVIEHVPDPMGLLDEAAGRLRPGGALLVATPNPKALSLRLCGRWWRHIDAPRHLHLIPYEVLRARARSRGLRVVGVTTTDPFGLRCDEVASSAWADHVARRLGGRAGIYNAAANAAMRQVERRGMRGSSYTAVFQRPA